MFQDEINAECQRRNAERMAQIKSETSTVKNSTEHRISPERRKSLERRKSPERRISPERRKSSEHRRSLERLPGERAEKRIRLRDDISGNKSQNVVDRKCLNEADRYFATSLANFKQC